MGNFPLGWAEWNDQYRDGMRGFWKGDGGLLGEMARRVTGSEDLYGWSGKKPTASINFVTAHDGFTLHDLVSYNEKHNEDNGEDNRDGNNNNVSWNYGVEGPTDNPKIVWLREQQKRNFIGTLLLSQGVPMLLAGDEVGRTQNGNNNAYCQDNELSWLSWDVESDPRKKKFLQFVQRCATIWREQPVLQRRKFFLGRSIRGDGIKDVSFFAPSGKDMTDEEWNAPFVNCLGMRLAGDLMNEVDERGEPIVGDTLMLLLNHHWEEVPFVLPPTSDGHVWETMIDTRDDDGPRRVCRGGEPFPLFGRSLALLRTVARDEAGDVASTPQLEAMRKELRRPPQVQR